ncbi:MAG TPA: alpha/beta family hydrolase [Candidatus Baltobacteraceae bacterium]|jgi:putative phosphoribosyl transferase|nr:alpha/beta family hydrolase [Candidatus Baltobacteraceae bacterium]
MSSHPVAFREVRVDAGDGVVALGFLALPEKPKGFVLFAHGSGSSRLSPRNHFVADALNRSNIATLRLDLLTPQEEAIDRRTAESRFDIALLARRLVAATSWVREQRELRDYPIGYFGASTGAAAALVAAARIPKEVTAVVSRGGRPDLAGDHLQKVRAPTLLTVGGADPKVLALNRRASAQMTCNREIVIVPDAGHLFEERGALEEVAHLARYWFGRYLQK